MLTSLFSLFYVTGEFHRFLHQGRATKCAPQFELNRFVTMAIYWVPDIPNIKGIFGHHWRSVFIFANGALYT